MVLQNIVPIGVNVAVQLKTILNSLERHKSFVYQEARWSGPETKTTIEIPIDLAGIESIGVDEVQWQKGHQYLTLVLVRLQQGRSTTAASDPCTI